MSLKKLHLKKVVLSIRCHGWESNMSIRCHGWESNRQHISSDMHSMALIDPSII